MFGFVAHDGKSARPPNEVTAFDCCNNSFLRRRQIDLLPVNPLALVSNHQAPTVFAQRLCCSDGGRGDEPEFVKMAAMTDRNF
jgi:hypothetical protein